MNEQYTLFFELEHFKNIDGILDVIGTDIYREIIEIIGKRKHDDPENYREIVEMLKIFKGFNKINYIEKTFQEYL